MRRTAAGSALVCAGFVLGALGATLAGHAPNRAPVVLLRAAAPAHEPAARSYRSAPTALAARNRPVAGATAPHHTVTPALVPPPPPVVATPAGPAAGRDDPAPGCLPAVGGPTFTGTAGNDSCPGTVPTAAGLDVSLDPFRQITAATAGLFPAGCANLPILTREPAPSAAHSAMCSGLSALTTLTHAATPTEPDRPVAGPGKP
jgi:hypothetical protein